MAFQRLDEDRLIPETWRSAGDSPEMEQARADAEEAMGELLIAPDRKMKAARTVLMRAKAKVAALEKAAIKRRAGKLDEEDVNDEDLFEAKWGWVQPRDKNKPKVYSCMGCGEAIEKDEDGKKPEKHIMARRIVRPGNNFGGSKAGDEVFVEVRHLQGAVLEATMSPAEFSAAEERARRPRERQVPRLQQMVNATADAFAKQSKELIARARKGKGRDAQRAAKEAQELSRNPRAVDQEPDSLPRSAVEGEE